MVNFILFQIDVNPTICTSAIAQWYWSHVVAADRVLHSTSPGTVQNCEQGRGETAFASVTWYTSLLWPWGCSDTASFRLDFHTCNSKRLLLHWPAKFSESLSQCHVTILVKGQMPDRTLLLVTIELLHLDGAANQGSSITLETQRSRNTAC